MRDLRNVQPLADFDWDAVGEQGFNYSADQHK